MNIRDVKPLDIIHHQTHGYGNVLVEWDDVCHDVFRTGKDVVTVRFWEEPDLPKHALDTGPFWVVPCSEVEHVPFTRVAIGDVVRVNGSEDKHYVHDTQDVTIPMKSFTVFYPRYFTVLLTGSDAGKKCTVNYSLLNLTKLTMDEYLDFYTLMKKKHGESYAPEDSKKIILSALQKQIASVT